MLIFLVPIVIGFVALSLGAIGNKNNCEKEVTKLERWCYKQGGALSVFAVFSFAIFVIMLIALAISHVEYAAFPVKYEAVTMTLAESRNAGSGDIERAAIMHKIIDMNKEIASVKYWDDSIWVGWFFPDRVADLELIK